MMSRGLNIAILVLAVLVLVSLLATAILALCLYARRIEPLAQAGIGMNSLGQGHHGGAGA